MSLSPWHIPIPPSLTAYVQAISVDDPAQAQTQSAYHVLPGLGAVIGFQYRGRLAVQQGEQINLLETSGITGLQTGARHFIPDPTTRSILVHFTAYGAYALLGCAMDELANQHLPLPELVPSAARLADQLADSEPHVAAAHVCDWLLALQKQGRDVHPDLQRATAQLSITHGNLPIEQLATDLGISRRQLERLFRLQVGVSPKEWASLARFQWTLAHLPTRHSWADIALTAGYTDQAHLIRSFQRRTGLTPGDYLRQTASRAFVEANP